MEVTYLYSEAYNEAVKMVNGEGCLIVSIKSKVASISTGTDFSIRVYRTAWNDGLFRETSAAFFDEFYTRAQRRLYKLTEA
jgi:hypothetical protein